MSYWHGLKWRDFTNLKDDYPDKLFIFISQERGGLPEEYLVQKYAMTVI